MDAKREIQIQPRLPAGARRDGRELLLGLPLDVEMIEDASWSPSSGAMTPLRSGRDLRRAYRRTCFATSTFPFPRCNRRTFSSMLLCLAVTSIIAPLEPPATCEFPPLSVARAARDLNMTSSTEPTEKAGDLAMSQWRPTGDDHPS